MSDDSDSRRGRDYTAAELKNVPHNVWRWKPTAKGGKWDLVKDGEQQFVDEFVRDLRDGKVPEPAAIEVAASMLKGYLQKRPRTRGRPTESDMRVILFTAVEQVREPDDTHDDATRKAFPNDPATAGKVYEWYRNAKHRDELAQALNRVRRKP